MATVEEATALLDSAVQSAEDSVVSPEGGGDDDSQAGDSAKQTSDASGSQEIAVLASQAEQLMGAGSVSEAIPLLEEALLRGGKEDPELRSALWNLLGNAHFRRHDFRKATYCHLHDLAACREAGDGEGCTKAYVNLGLAFKHMGRYEQAGQCFLSQLRSCERRRHQTGIARAFNNLAQLTMTMAKAEIAKAGKKRVGSQSESIGSAPLSDRAKELLRQAIEYFKRHLLVVQKQRDR